MINQAKTETNKNVVMLIAAMSSFLTPFTGSSVNIALPSMRARKATNKY